MERTVTVTAGVVTVTEDIVVAGVCIVDVDTSGSRITTVIGTDVAVVTVKG